MKATKRLYACVRFFSLSDSLCVCVFVCLPISRDHYFVQVAWRDNSHVSVVWSNRAQNKTVTTIYNVVTGTSFNVSRSSLFLPLPVI